MTKRYHSPIGFSTVKGRPVRLLTSSAYPHRELFRTVALRLDSS